MCAGPRPWTALALIAGLLALPSPAVAAAAPANCDAADRLLADGLRDDARAAYERLLKTDAPPECAAAGLAAVTTKEKEARTWTDEVGGWADDAFSALDEILKALLLAVLALGVAGAILVRLGPVASLRRLAWRLHRARPSWGAVRRSGNRILRLAFAPLVWAVATPVRLEKVEGPDKEGEAMTRALKAMVPVLASPRRGDIQVVVAPFGAKSALGEVTDAIGAAPAYGKPVAAVLKIAPRLLPRKQLQVSGAMVDGGSRGAGLSLWLSTEGGALIDAVAIWDRELEPYKAPGAEADDPAATRTSRLATAGAVWLHFAVLRYRRALRPEEWQAALGTSAWRSYAAFQIAVAASPGAHPLVQQALHARAVEQDPENLPALYSLAVVDVRRGEYGQAKRRLERVRVDLDRREQGVELLDRDPLRYQAAYTSAHARLRDGEPAAANAAALGRTVTELVEAIDALGEDRERRVTVREDLLATLRRYEGPTLVLLAHLLRVAGLTHTEGGPAHADVMERLETKVSVTPATHYNLACYYGGAGPMPRAFRELEAALEAGRFADTAADDPDLAPLRQADGAGFDRLLAEYRAEPVTGLGRLTAIGLAHADALRRRGILDLERLVTRTRTAQERLYLGARVGAGPALVERWARLADLEPVVGSIEHLNLLDAAGAGSRQALALLDAPRLRELLRASAPAGTTLPGQATLRDWIAMATADAGRIEAAGG